MTNTNLDLAVAYYTAMGNKDIDGVAKHLHPDVHFIGPMAETRGKEALVASVKGFMSIFKLLTIRAKFGSENQAMLAYDVDCPPPIGISRGASLLTFENELITKVELFYDARFAEAKKDEIFGR